MNYFEQCIVERIIIETITKNGLLSDKKESKNITLRTKISTRGER